jgi:hypothetical protein
VDFLIVFWAGRPRLPMRTRLDSVVLVAMAAGVLVGTSCNSESATSTGSTGGGHGAPATTTHGGVPLLPVRRPVERLCHSVARRASLSILCPSVLPRASVGTRPTDPPAPLRALGFGSRSERDFHLLFIYNAPSENLRRNDPARFLHFDVLGYRRGVVVRQDLTHVLLDTSARSPTGPRFLRRVRRLDIGGRRGVLYSGLPFDKGGNELGGHYTFIWPEGEMVIGASLHAWTPSKHALETLKALVSHLKVVRP